MQFEAADLVRGAVAVLDASYEAQARVPAKSTPTKPADEAGPQQSGRDLADLALAAMRLQAQIDKQIEEYQKRPRKKFIGANAAEYRFAQYEEEWRAKVERWGTVNYPPEARGKIYGNLRLTVTLRPDGSVDNIELDRSSGLKILDAHVNHCVADALASGDPDQARAKTAELLQAVERFARST